jgi:hypothetical protein
MSSRLQEGQCPPNGCRCVTPDAYGGTNITLDPICGFTEIRNGMTFTFPCNPGCCSRECKGDSTYRPDPPRTIIDFLRYPTDLRLLPPMWVVIMFVMLLMTIVTTVAIVFT